MSVKICCIVAMDEARVIGSNNSLPWHLPEDLKHFSALTTGHTVLMGRKTYESLPDRFRPLPKRKNVVVTRSPQELDFAPEVEVISDPVEYLRSCSAGLKQLPSDVLWIIGGEQIYRLCLPLCDELFVTKVSGKYEGDVFFPEFEQDFELTEEKQHQGWSFCRYLRA